MRRPVFQPRRLGVLIALVASLAPAYSTAAAGSDSSDMTLPLADKETRQLFSSSTAAASRQLTTNRLRERLQHLRDRADTETENWLALIHNYTGMGIDQASNLLEPTLTLDLEQALHILIGLISAENDLLVLATTDDQKTYRRVLQAMIFLELALGRYLSAAPEQLVPLFRAYIAAKAAVLQTRRVDLNALLTLLHHTSFALKSMPQPAPTAASPLRSTMEMAINLRTCIENAQQLWQVYTADEARLRSLATTTATSEVESLPWFSAQPAADVQLGRTVFSPMVTARMIPNDTAPTATTDATDIDDLFCDIGDLFCYEKGLPAPVSAGGDIEMLAAASPAADTVGGVVMPIIPAQPNSFGPLRISVPTRRGVKRTSPDNDTDTDDSNTSDSDTEDYAAGPIGRAGATPKRARWAIPQQAHWDDRNEL